MEGELTKIRKKQGREITAAEDIIHARQDEETIFLKAIGRILNCEAWGGDEDEIEEDIGFADRAVKKIYNHFQKPLENAGVCKTERISRSVARSGKVCKNLFISFKICIPERHGDVSLTVVVRILISRMFCY